MTPAAARRPARRAVARSVRRRPRCARLAAIVTDGRGRPTSLGRGLGAWLADAAPRGVGGVVAIALVPDATMRSLNRDFRGVDRATDVLSFGVRSQAPGPRPQADSDRRASGVFGARGKSPEGRALAGGGRPSADAGAWGQGPGARLGDVAIAVGVARRQARKLGHSLATELRVLALHGLLHLLGYDHEADQGEMGRLEDRLRRHAGLPSALIARVARAATRR